MHRKERVIAPILEEMLGLRVEVVRGLDTDHFGTFTREVPRPGTQLETARLKAQAALAAVPEAAFGLASEGSFGPHPWLPWVAGGRELIMLVGRDAGLELVGADLTAETNHGSRLVGSVAEALAFAQGIGFPTHAVVVMGVHNGEPEVLKGVSKGLMTTEELDAAVRVVLERHGAAHVESDMRAHVNPTRMAAIGRATRDLVHLALSGCPSCGRPGFDVVERLRGLPCAECGLPTRRVRIDIVGCTGCGCREERLPSTGTAPAAPGECNICNP
jgi:ribosomal protein L37E